MVEKSDDNLGLLIKERRVSKNLSAITCARRLKIKQDYIRSIESGRLEQLPTGARLEKIIRRYLELLDFSTVEIETIVTYWQKNSNHQRQHNFFGRRLVRRRDLWSWPHIVRNTLVVLVILVIVAYIVFSLKNIVADPELRITSPAGDVATSERQIWLNGETEPEVKLEINGEQLLSDRQGKFSHPVNLRVGINNLKITAIKKYGGQTTIIRQILVSEK